MEEKRTYEECSDYISANLTTRTIMEGNLQTGSMGENRTYEERRNYISASLTTRTILEQLAEESAELSQAALKLIRASGASENKANISNIEAEANLIEEIRDVLMIIDLLGLGLEDLVKKNEGYFKWQRWFERLTEKKGGSYEKL